MGRLTGATDTGVVASHANAGAAGGERLPHDSTRQRHKRVGPRQRPLEEEIDAQLAGRKD
eukprot:gene37799-56744_t